MWQAVAIETEIERGSFRRMERHRDSMTDTLKHLNAEDRRQARGRTMMLELMLCQLSYLALHHDRPIGEVTKLDLAELWSSQLPPAARR